MRRRKSLAQKRPEYPARLSNTVRIARPTQSELFAPSALSYTLYYTCRVQTLHGKFLIIYPFPFNTKQDDPFRSRHKNNSYRRFRGHFATIF